MLPSALQVEQFQSYPPEARNVVVSHLAILRQLPLSFLPSLLREIIDYDYKFPIERSAIDKELASLTSLPPGEFKDRFLSFAQISLSSTLEQFDWINLPAQFVEQQSAYLWTTHQLDAFRKAATEYGTSLQASAPPDPISMRRVGVAVFGQGAASFDGPLFRNLRQHGTYFGQVKPHDGLKMLLDAVGARAKAHPLPYAHWYVDGGRQVDHSPLLTCVSYQKLEAVRANLLKRMQADIDRPGMGPEELRTLMAQLTPAEFGMEAGNDAVLNRFQLKLFTEGSGTQIFSTTFAQWTAREVLRRAQALTLLVRFAPRQRQRPMNELLSSTHDSVELDFVGSLVDADMGAYYQWINQQRLPGSEQSSFLAWFEGHNQAIAIAPSFPRGTESSSAIDLGQLFSLIAG
jgi:hypothetical protein